MIKKIIAAACGLVLGISLCVDANAMVEFLPNRAVHGGGDAGAGFINLEQRAFVNGLLNDVDESLHNVGNLCAWQGYTETHQITRGLLNNTGENYAVYRVCRDPNWQVRLDQEDLFTNPQQAIVRDEIIADAWADDMNVEVISITRPGTTLRHRAIRNCPNLRCIILGRSVDIDAGAIEDCGNLKIIVSGKASLAGFAIDPLLNCDQRVTLYHPGDNDDQWSFFGVNIENGHINDWGGKAVDSRKILSEINVLRYEILDDIRGRQEIAHPVPPHDDNH